MSTLKIALEAAAIGQKVCRTGSSKYAVRSLERMTEEETSVTGAYLMKFASTQNETVRGGEEIVKFEASKVSILNSLLDEWSQSDYSVVPSTMAVTGVKYTSTEAGTGFVEALISFSHDLTEFHEDKMVVQVANRGSSEWTTAEKVSGKANTVKFPVSGLKDCRIVYDGKITTPAFQVPAAVVLTNVTRTAVEAGEGLVEATFTMTENIEGYSYDKLVFKTAPHGTTTWTEAAKVDGKANTVAFPATGAIDCQLVYDGKLVSATYQVS